MSSTGAGENIIRKVSFIGGSVTLTNQRVMFESDFYFIDGLRGSERQRGGNKKFPIQSVNQIKVIKASGMGCMGLTSAPFIVIETSGSDYYISIESKSVGECNALVSDFHKM